MNESEFSGKWWERASPKKKIIYVGRIAVFLPFVIGLVIFILSVIIILLMVILWVFPGMLIAFIIAMIVEYRLPKEERHFWRPLWLSFRSWFYISTYKKAHLHYYW